MNAQVILSQSIHDQIYPSELDGLVPSDTRMIEIAVKRGAIEKSADWDFEQLSHAQKSLFETEFLPALSAFTNQRPELLYVGFAPIPLALHLGFLCNTQWVRVRNRNQAKKTWEWLGRTEEDPSFEIISKLGSFPKGEGDDVVVKISTSYPLDHKDIEAVIPNPAMTYEINLQNIEPDGLRSLEEVRKVAEVFRGVLDEIGNLGHEDIVVHLFAAVPTGLAFLLGTKIHASSHPPVVTYKYVKGRTPRHQKAITVGMDSPSIKTILFCGANPPGTHALDIPREFEKIKEVLSLHPRRERIQIIIEPKATAGDIIRLIIDHQPDIIHFSGHGSRTEGNHRDLSVHSKRTDSHKFSSKDLRNVFSSLPYLPELVILNACHSEQIGHSIEDFVGCVIGIQQQITDEGAIMFSSIFYAALANGGAIANAFKLSTSGLETQKDRPALIPGKLDPNNVYLLK